MLSLYSQPEPETRSSLLVLPSKEEQVVKVCFQYLDSHNGGPIESRGKMYNNKKWSQAISKIKQLHPPSLQRNTQWRFKSKPWGGKTTTKNRQKGHAARYAHSIM
jgi:hypothetical protein|tara:strand:+ start:443 stop:757 length:315 start_codon:yes stop_codon:yes gene_type:complete